MPSLRKIHEKGVTTLSPHVLTKKKLKAIDTVTDFESLLSISVLTDEEKTILRMFYLKGQNFGFIADTLGCSEATVYKKHAKALDRLCKLL